MDDDTEMSLGQARGWMANVIRNLVKEFDEHPFDINNGFCEDFAERLVEECGDGEAVWLDCIDEEAQALKVAHCVFVYRGFYFDAEEPYGVDDWRYLPICVRAARLKRIKD